MDPSKDAELFDRLTPPDYDPEIVAEVDALFATESDDVAPVKPE